MPRDPDRPRWKGQKPWLEAWFAVVLDAGRRRALWIRQTMFVPRDGDGRATIWGAWFDADATPSTGAAKRYVSIERAAIERAGIESVQAGDVKAKIDAKGQDDRGDGVTGR